MLVFSTASSAETISDPALLKTSYEGALPLGDILHLDTIHLLALGTGIVLGSTIIAQRLEVGEFTGMIIGLIGGDLLYRLLHNRSDYNRFLGLF